MERMQSEMTIEVREHGYSVAITASILSLDPWKFQTDHKYQKLTKLQKAKKQSGLHDQQPVVAATAPAMNVSVSPYCSSGASGGETSAELSDDGLTQPSPSPSNVGREASWILPEALPIKDAGGPGGPRLEVLTTVPSLALVPGTVISVQVESGAQGGPGPACSPHTCVVVMSMFARNGQLQYLVADILQESAASVTTVGPTLSPYRVASGEIVNVLPIILALPSHMEGFQLHHRLCRDARLVESSAGCQEELDDPDLWAHILQVRDNLQIDRPICRGSSSDSATSAFRDMPC